MSLLLDLAIITWLFIFVILYHTKPDKERPTLVFLKQIKHRKMAIVSTATLTSLVAETFPLSVVDSNNNNKVITGTLSNISVVSADSTQDTAVVNGTGVDVDAVSETGGTTVTATATFVSDKMKADGVTPIVSGTFTSVLTIVNNVVVNAVLVFNQ